VKAVLVHRNAVLRDSHIEPTSSPESWRLMPATVEAMRLLATEERLLFLYGPRTLGDGAQVSDPPGDHESWRGLLQQIEAGGGRVDGFIICHHGEGQACRCWGEVPGIFYGPAAQFGLELEMCYLLADDARDIAAAYVVGSRPILMLGERTLSQVLGNRPAHKDFPVATNLTMAVEYIQVEEEINAQLGHPRNVATPPPPAEQLLAHPEALPRIEVTSRLAHGLEARLIRARAQMSDLVRWLSFFVFGAMGLSLGIAYLLTHLYRVHPFPQFAYYITLQFIPRPVRGALFIVFGIGVILLVVRSFYRSTRLLHKPGAE
jgi:histidinol phosphatase-like enzyme